MNKIFIHETLLTNRLDRKGDREENDFLKLSFASGSAIKRQMILDKHNYLSSIFGMRRVVRIHCIFDSNLKIQIRSKNNNELVFGNMDINHNKFDNHILVFEC